MIEFPKTYQWEVLAGLPGSGEIHQFRWEQHSLQREGLVVRVVPSAREPWIGNFQKGDLAFTKVFPSPAEDVICVIAGGQGYVVPVARPREYSIIDIYPVRDVLIARERKLMILATYTSLAAYGPSGVVWETDKLARDDVTMTRLTSDTVFGSGWDPVLKGTVNFEVKLDTGQHRVWSSRDYE